jgi:hypothetical protein
MPREQDCTKYKTTTIKIRNVEAAHFELCGSAKYPVVLNILSLDRMAER